MGSGADYQAHDILNLLNFLNIQVKFHDIATYQTVHSISFPSPILTAAVASDDSIVCAGMSDGLVQFLHRKESMKDNISDER